VQNSKLPRFPALHGPGPHQFIAPITRRAHRNGWPNGQACANRTQRPQQLPARHIAGCCFIGAATATGRV